MTETTVTTYPALNVDLLQRTLDHIKEVPEGWDQNTWRKILTDDNEIATLGPTMCGTAMCFAGEAVHLHDPNAWLINTEVIAKVAQAQDYELSREISYLSEYVLVDSAGYHVDVPEAIAALRGIGTWCPAVTANIRAIELLGITRAEADALFDETNTLEQLEAMVASLLAGQRGYDALCDARGGGD